jgi:hypothetical protein
MYRIIDGRGTGKTSRLMLLAKENNGIIVCSNPIKMAEKAEVYGIIGLTFVSYKQFMETPIDPFVNYYIDELEGFVKAVMAGKGQFQGYTLSEE